MEQPEERELHKHGLPKPELNPMLNSVLGQNLGRWAQVYFTNPPEKRDQAVIELLRVLENESQSNGNHAGSEPSVHQEDPAPAQWKHLQQRANGLCPMCRAENASGQKFCGMCGASLEGKTTSRPTWSRVSQNSSETPVSNRVAQAAEPAPEWVREKIFTGTLLADAEPEHPSGWGKYAMFAVLVLLVGFGALQWLSNTPPKVVVTSTAAQSRQTSSTAPQVSSTNAADNGTAPPNAAAGIAAPEASAAAPAKADIPQTLTSGNVPPSPSGSDKPAIKTVGIERQIADQQPQTSRAASATRGAPTSMVGGNGTQELQMAQYYLSGKDGARDSAEAAKWLWKALAKQNPNAGVMLANLYMRGDGVAKNCDQARLLLVAASEKGSTEAAASLRTLESTGCQ